LVETKPASRRKRTKKKKRGGSLFGKECKWALSKTRGKGIGKGREANAKGKELNGAPGPTILTASVDFTGERMGHLFHPRERANLT